MPNWNLKADWPYPGYFWMPINGNLNLDDLALRIEEDVEHIGVEEGYGPKILIIDIQTTDEIPVSAMIPGAVYTNVDSLTLFTNILTLSGLLGLTGMTAYELYAEFPDIRWFQNWLDANRSPQNIIYENINTTLADGSIVRGGDIIGTALENPNDPSKKQLKIKIEYSDSTDSNPKFMHPREFFGLLFWLENRDPFFAASPIEYGNPLLKKMMRLYDDGNPVINEIEGPVDDLGDILNNVFRRHPNIERWLGLRPPLRIYRRVEWESIVTHRVHHDNWQSADIRSDGRCCVQLLPYGDLSNVIRNPLILVGSGLRTASKCNLFVAEMAFRAGFKTFVIPTGNRIKPLWYLSRGPLLSSCNDTNCDRIEEVFSVSSPPTISWPSPASTYSLSRPFGKKRYVTDGNKRQINQEISNDGKVIIYARNTFCMTPSLDYAPTLRISASGRRELHCEQSGIDYPDHKKVFHVFLVSNITRVTSTDIIGNRIDQHLDPDNPIPLTCNRAWCGSLNQSTRAFIELIPGGDPTEEWGMLDLNCLVEVT